MYAGALRSSACCWTRRIVDGVAAARSANGLPSSPAIESGRDMAGGTGESCDAEAGDASESWSLSACWWWRPCPAMCEGAV